MRFVSLVLLAASGTILLGCSFGTPVLPSDTNPPDSVSQASSGPGSRCLWGYWELRFSRERGTAEVIPLRHGQMHVNVLKFLEGEKTYLGLENLKIAGEYIDVDVKLTHPFPGLDKYTGFDVRGILITPGSVSGYSDPGIVHANWHGTYLANADGWTRWWNPTEFPVGNTILSYVNGKMGTPYNGQNLNATLNGYKYFSDDLKADDSLAELKPSHRGLFRCSSTNRRHYRIHFDPTKPLIFNYAVDASWWLPTPDPPVAIPDDFPKSANAPEAYMLSAKLGNNNLFYIDPENKGGKADLELFVYDFWGCGDTEVTLEAPGVWSMGPSAPIYGSATCSVYWFELDGNALKSADPVDVLVTATSLDATYTVGDLADKNVAAYAFLTIPVSGTPLHPTVAGIDPDHEIIGNVLTGAEVTGSNFAANAQVSLIKHDNPALVIEAQNEQVTGGTSIVCDIHLDGPAAETGKYDVRVTNPDTGLYGELTNGFTVYGPKHPWPGWMAAGLNQAASEYVGFGGPGISGTPKWVYQAPGYGGPSAGCAVANDGMIYVCTYGASPGGPKASLHAVKPDGTLAWIFNKTGTCWNCLCPAIDPEGYVYVCLGTPSVNYLYKIDPKTATEVWACNIGSAPCYPGAPAVGLDGAVYVFTGSILDNTKLQRVNPDGTPGWSVNLYPFAYSYSWQLGTAVLKNGNIVCSGGSTGKIFCFQPNGTPVWEYQHNWWTLSTPVVGPEGNIYFTDWEGGSLTALDSNGNFLWDFDTGFFVWAAPAVDPTTGHVFFGDRLGKFRCFDSSGNVLWTTDFGDTHIDGTAAVDGNGDVYVAVGNQPSQPFKGLVKMDGENGAILWQSDDLGYMLTAAPSIGFNGTIYLPGYDNQHVLFAWGE